MRTCVLGVIGEIVAQSLTKEHLSEEQKETRDIFLEHLEDHLIDTNASVRGKVIHKKYVFHLDFYSLIVYHYFIVRLI